MKKPAGAGWGDFDLPIWALILAGMTGFALWLGWFFQAVIMNYFGFYWYLPTVGAWGDSFGALNAFFAAFAAFSILITLRFQQIQIADSARDQHRQRFETTFFELLHLLREEREKLRFKYSQDYIAQRYPNSKVPTFVRNASAEVGTLAVRAAVKEAQFWINKLNEDERSNRVEIISIYQEKIHRRYESSLGPYFRLIYTILNRIHTDKFLSEEEKHDYGRLVRNQLTSYEAALAGINGLSPVSKDFPMLVTRFRLLKYISESRTRDFLKLHYPAETFYGRRVGSSNTV